MKRRKGIVDRKRKAQARKHAKIPHKCATYRMKASLKKALDTFERNVSRGLA